MSTSNPQARLTRRRRIGRALTELHYSLRTEGDSPIRTALAVGLGTMIGCTPLYGGHLPICIVVARVCRISRIKTYLAAHISNPLTAPGLLYLGFSIGHMLLRGSWPSIRFDELQAIGFLGVSRDLLVGSLVLGVILGCLLGLAAFVVSTRARPDSLFSRLSKETARLYEGAGIRHWEFVRGKLRYDPVYRGLIESVRLPDDGRLVDLGCGRGIALSMMQAARGLHQRGEWTDELPDPPLRLQLHGVELRPDLVEVARGANGDGAAIERGDLSTYEPPSADVFLLLDVLHYMASVPQQRLLSRIATALRDGGVLLIREANSDLGWRFRWTRLWERVFAVLRFRWGQRFHYRGAAEWCRILEATGLECNVVPMWGGTPHGNVLIAARKSTRPCKTGA